MSLGKHLSKRLADGHVIPVLGFGTSAPPKVITAALGMQGTGRVPIRARHPVNLEGPHGPPFPHL